MRMNDVVTHIFNVSWFQSYLLHNFMKVAKIWLYMWLWKSQEITFLVWMFIYLFVWRWSYIYVCVVQLMKQVLINPMEDCHHVWLYGKSLIIKGWWCFYPRVLNFFMFQYFYFNNYVISIWFMNYYNSTQRRDYNNVILNYMIVVRSNERTMIWSLIFMINVISNLIFIVVRLF